MFGFGKKAKTEIKTELYAPCDGKVIECSEIPDEVFAMKILGDGFAVVPENGEVVSPCAGKIIDVQDSLHAYGIETDDGLEILVHIGVNTVALNGEGFEAKVKSGDKVAAGQTLAKVDFNLIRSKGYADCVVVLITSMEDVTSVSVSAGECHTGDAVVTYIK